MRQLLLVLSCGLIVATAAPVMAQGGAQKDSGKKGNSIPADARPPKGMCRIWIEGVPAAQQPAATDCPTAIKNRPSNGKVIFGDDFADSAKKAADKSKLPPNAKGFTGGKPPQFQLKRPE